MRLSPRAFARAGGTVCAAAVFGLTVLFLVGPGRPSSLEPLAGLLFGYSVSVAGAFVGALWAFAYGFVAAGAMAFVYNLALVPPPPLPAGSDEGAPPESESA